MHSDTGLDMSLMYVCVQLLQSLPSALVSPTPGLQTILISPQTVTKPVSQTSVASSPATSIVTMAPSAGAGVTLGSVTPNQPSTPQFPLFRIPEVFNSRVEL